MGRSCFAGKFSWSTPPLLRPLPPFEVGLVLMHGVPGLSLSVCLTFFFSRCGVGLRPRVPVFAASFSA